MVIVLVALAGAAPGAERFVPSTVSEEAAEVIRSVKPGDENATSTAEWQALRIPEERDAWRDMAAFFARHWAR